MKKVLVTGGAGFIGSHLARRLLSNGWEVHIVDNLSTGFKENIPHEAKFVFLDVSKDSFVKSLPDDKYDAIFHLAGQSSGETSFDDPLYDLHTNCTSTLILLDWCLKRGIKRFIYASSMSVYGEHEIQPANETYLAHPKSFYGVGKLASENYLNIYFRLGINTTSLRLFNVYGPGQNMENLRQGMVSIYMAYILKKEPILVKGSPERYRDFVYIDDVIDVFMLCLDNMVTYGKTYNVAFGKKTSVRELLEAELKAFQLNPLTYPIKYSGSTPGDICGIYADISAIKNDTNWKPKVSLDDGLAKMAEWAILKTEKL